MRLFLGIEVPDHMKARLSSSLSSLITSPKGWELPHDYHLTLLYIGESTEAEKQDIIKRLAKIRVSPFQITFAGYEFFPRRILYQSVEASEGLMKLKDSVENEFTEWVDPTAKPFKPHLTVKRFQRYEQEALIKSLMRLPHLSQTFEVNHLALFKSEKDSENNKYHVIHRGTLA